MINLRKYHLIFAKTPQAKRRIERLWGTLQGHLPIEFRKRGITTISTANEFLQSYRFLYNEKFSVEPEETSLFILMKSDIFKSY